MVKFSELPYDVLVAIASCMTHLAERNRMSLVCKRLCDVSKENVVYEQIMKSMWGQRKEMSVQRCVLTPCWKKTIQYRMSQYPFAYRKLFQNQSYLSPKIRFAVLEWMMDIIVQRYKRHEHGVSQMMLCQVIAVSVFDRFVCSKANTHDFSLHTIAAAAYIVAQCHGNLRNLDVSEYAWVSCMTEGKCETMIIYVCSLTMINAIKYKNHVYKKWFCGYMDVTCNEVIQERDFCIMIRVLRMLQSLNSKEVVNLCVKFMLLYLISDMSLLFAHEQAAIAIVRTACVVLKVPSLLRDSVCAQYYSKNADSESINRCSRRL